MAGATGKSFVGRFGVHIAVLVFVAIWTIPTLGILVSSLRDKDQIIASGWWSSFSSSSQTEAGRLPAASAQVEKDGKFVIEGNIFGDGAGPQHQRLRRQDPPARRSIAAGTTADLGDGVTLQVNADGSFVMPSPKAFEGDRGQRVYYASSAPPKFTTDNYQTVLFSEGIGRSFMNSLTVTIPATVIPILIAAFAAYALAWMRFPGRALLIAVIIGLLVVPLQMSLIPLLKLYNGVGAFFGVPVEDLSRHLAGAYRLRPALRHLSAAQLHRRPAARNHGIGAHRRRQRLRDLRQDRAAAVVPGARLLRHLPVPVGLERPAGRDGVPRHRSGPDRADRPSSTRCSARAAATGRS